MSARGPVEIRHQDAVDVEGKSKSDQIRLLERTEFGEAGAEAVLDDLVDRLDSAVATGDEGDRLSLERVLEAIADEPTTRDRRRPTALSHATGSGS